MNPRKQEYVVFFSPGTLFSESTSKEIDSRDTNLAVQMAESIVERYNAIPYGFKFRTLIVADPISDGQGGTLHVESKCAEESGMYFLGGKIETLDIVELRNDPKEDILRSNMRWNRGYEVICINTRKYKSTHPFTEKDFVVDALGKIVERGDDPKYVNYRLEVRSNDRDHR